MLKSLRSGQKGSKYFNGGQAEKIFRGQFDQQIAEDMARQHGAAFANPLFDAYSRQASLNKSGADRSSPMLKGPLSSNQTTSREGAHALDVVA
jgi:Rod binding domain-containing protein